MKPYPFTPTDFHTPTAHAEIEEESSRAAGIACLGVVAFLFLLALVAWAARFFLKG